MTAPQPAGSQRAWDSGLQAQLKSLRLDLDAANPDASRHALIERLGTYGFALLRGLGSGDREHCAATLLTLSRQLGSVVPQSPRGELVEDVRDFSDVDERDDRGYRSRGELSPHSDPTTLIALHCLRPARQGGESYIVSVRALHDAIERQRPDLLQTLYGNFPHWRVEGAYGQQEAGPDAQGRPIFARQHDRVSCVIYRPFVELAAEALAKPLSESQIEALDLFETLANDERLALRFTLAPGDTLILHNRTALHARTDYEDWPEPERRRHLLRTWIDAPATFPVKPEHALGNLFPGVGG